MLENESISVLAKKKSRDEVFLSMPLQTHWFAVSLYGVFAKFKETTFDRLETWSVEIEGQQYTLDLKILTKASKLIQTASRLRHDAAGVPHGISATKGLRESELALSSLFSVAINLLLCSGPDLDTMLIHQGPVRKKPRKQGNPDSADLLGVRLSGNSRCDPYESIFVSDLKLCDKDTSDKETALYGKFLSLNQNNPSDAQCMLVLGLSGTPFAATLWAYVMGNRRVWAIPIVSDVFPYEPSLLATLTIGLLFLSSNPVFYQVLEHPKPFRDLEVTPLKANKHNRTYLKTEGSHQTVVKFFDSEDMVRRSNVHIMNIAGMVVQENLMTTDGKVSYIEYKYYDGGHQPVALRQFHNILCMLHQLHVKGYVHGDIRPSNLVFDQHGRDGYLIDYDLVGKNKQDFYPVGYYYSKAIRHKDARAGRPMQQSHDRHSLALILEEHYPAANTVITELRSSEPLTKAADLLAVGTEAPSN